MLAVVDAVVKSPLYLPASELYNGRSKIGQRHIAGGQRAALPVESGAVDIRTLRHGIQFLRQFGRLVDDGGERIYSRADSKIEQPAVVNVQRPVGSGIII